MQYKRQPDSRATICAERPVRDKGPHIHHASRLPHSFRCLAAVQAKKMGWI
jgi:hypothetical protein